jgi:hypothetical protein
MRPDENYLTQNEAAAHVGTSLSTIERRRSAGRLPGARRKADGNGTWLIPHSDLVTAGLCTTPGCLGEALVTPGAVDELELMRVRLEATEQRAEDARQQVRQLQAVIDRLLPAREVA